MKTHAKQHMSVLIHIHDFYCNRS